MSKIWFSVSSNFYLWSMDTFSHTLKSVFIFNFFTWIFHFNFMHVRFIKFIYFSLICYSEVRLFCPFKFRKSVWYFSSMNFRSMFRSSSSIFLSRLKENWMESFSFFFALLNSFWPMRISWGVLECLASSFLIMEVFSPSLWISADISNVLECLLPGSLLW